MLNLKAEFGIFYKSKTTDGKLSVSGRCRMQAITTDSIFNLAYCYRDSAKRKGKRQREIAVQIIVEAIVFQDWIDEEVTVRNENRVLPDQTCLLILSGDIDMIGEREVLGITIA